MWNRTQKIQRAGTRSQRRRPPSEWVRLDAPDLQIIPTDLWATVHSRLEDAKRLYLRNQKGQLLTRPSGEKLPSKYLLSGLAKCGVCGGSVVAMTRHNGRHRRNLYGCVYHHKRGAAICSNHSLPSIAFDPAGIGTERSLYLHNFSTLQYDSLVDTCSPSFFILSLPIFVYRSYIPPSGLLRDRCP